MAVQRYRPVRAESRRHPAPTEVVVHGDGTSLWTLTHSDDFAKGFVPLLEQAAPEIIAWHDQDPSRQAVDVDLDALMNKLSAEFRVQG